MARLQSASGYENAPCDPLAHSTLMPVALTIPPNFSAWVARKSANSRADVTFVSTLNFARLFLTAGDPRLSLIAPLSLATTSGGVPAGATIPVQNDKS